MKTTRDRIMEATRRQARRERSFVAELGEDGLVYIMDGTTPRYVMSPEVFAKMRDESER